MSPGCADMGGVFIVPVEAEYDKLNPELLEEMLADYKGTVLFVSHDGAFVDAVATRLARFEDGKLNVLPTVLVHDRLHFGLIHSRGEAHTEAVLGHYLYQSSCFGVHGG
mgnify:CR=1 FL=1